MRLADIISLSAGYPFRSSVPECPGAGVYAVQMRDLSLTSGIDWERVTETELPGKRKPDWLCPGDILFTIRGNHNYAVLVDGRADDFKAVASPHFFILKCIADDVLPEFLVWQLNQKPLQKYFQKESEGSVTKNIRRAVLEGAPIVVPPLGRQRRIIALAQSIRQNNEILKQLIKNNEATMNCIAADLFDTKKQGGISL